MKMKLLTRRGYVCAVVCAVLTLAAGWFPAAAHTTAQKRSRAAVTTANDKTIISTFTGRANAFVKLRNRVRSRLPKLSKDSTAEQVASHKKAFEDAMRAARVNAKPGDIFTTGTGDYIRRLIRTEFKGTERTEVKKAILEAETAGVPLRVNYPYPETKEFSAIPPTLLLKLPLLPEELNYRFVGRHMLLVDKENGLILDYMLNALP